MDKGCESDRTISENHDLAEEREGSNDPKRGLGRFPPKQPNSYSFLSIAMRDDEAYIRDES